jgi:hypothetical protein
MRCGVEESSLSRCGQSCIDLSHESDASIRKVDRYSQDIEARIFVFLRDRVLTLFYTVQLCVICVNFSNIL